LFRVWRLVERRGLGWVGRVYFTLRIDMRFLSVIPMYVRTYLHTSGEYITILPAENLDDNSGEGKSDMNYKLRY
jgi:hypothetical protein